MAEPFTAPEPRWYEVTAAPPIGRGPRILLRAEPGITEITFDAMPGAFSYSEYAVPWRWRSIFRHPVRVIRSKLR